MDQQSHPLHVAGGEVCHASQQTSARDMRVLARALAMGAELKNGASLLCGDAAASSFDPRQRSFPGARAIA